MWPWVWIGISVKKIGCAYFKANCWISWIARRYQYLQYTSIYMVFQDLPHQTNLSVLYISKDISTMESMELPNSIPMSVCLKIWHPACPHLSSFSSLELQFWEHRQFETYAKYAKIVGKNNCQDNPALNAHCIMFCTQINPNELPFSKDQFYVWPRRFWHLRWTSQSLLWCSRGARKVLNCRRAKAVRKSQVEFLLLEVHGFMQFPWLSNMIYNIYIYIIYLYLY